MERAVDFHKAGGILIRDRKALITRTRGRDTFINPGGKLEPGETVEQALFRELAEELSIEVLPEDIEPFGTYYAKAAYQEDKRLRMDVFLVKAWEGELVPGREIEEIRWVSSKLEPGLKVGSIFEHEVVPRLKQRGLID